jgi:hypothetical protein
MATNNTVALNGAAIPVMALSTVGVVGTDGVVPVYDPDARWTQWALHEVYVGTVGVNRYVPKVGDWVIDTPAAKFYEVTEIDVTTLIPRMKSIRPLVQDQEFSNTDMILGVGPGGISDTFRAYLNKNVLPYTLTIDARLHTYSSEAESFTVFRGTDIEGTAKPISQMYNQSSELIGTAIPLTLAAIDGNNRTVKSFPMCYTTEDMPNGEKVVLIVFADGSHQVSKVELLIENTEFVPSADNSLKQITNISLESPFISPSDPNVLSFPLNVMMNGLSLMGVVHYNDGSKLRLPVNDTRFSLRGLDNFVSTYAGQKFDLVLDYKLAPEEVTMGLQTTPARSITRRYEGITTNFEGMYSPKLYGFPVWINSVRGYRIEWWLYDMERRMAQLVTPFVQYNANSRPFDPTGYGFKQSIGVTINLKDVNPSGLALNHVQAVDFVLRQQGTARTTNWAVGFIPNQEVLFGENNFAKMTLIDQNQMQLDITCGETTQVGWLERLYRLVHPLSDPGRESRAPNPTHFSVCTPEWEVAYPIGQWNKKLVLNYTVPNNGTLFIKFFIRTAETDIHLSVAGIPVYCQ